MRPMPRHTFLDIVLQENILLMEDRDVSSDHFSALLTADFSQTCKIVDFGVSEIFMKHGDDISTKSVGSPAFMSPEACSSKYTSLGVPYVR